MTTPAAREWVFSLEAIGIKLGLSQITTLLAALGHPERRFRSVTVAGTNGKGSTTAMIERGLRAAGLTTGRYTSPHLVHIEERITINGSPITAAHFDAYAAQVRAAADHVLPHPPSFFEATTAMALIAFAEAGVDTAVLEVGLGGRLDATNVVDAAVAVITPVDFDHQLYLGNTLQAIAGEKAGIIKPGALVCVGPQPDVARDVIAARAAGQGATVVWSNEAATIEASVDARGSDLHLTTPVRRYPRLRVGLAGRHQIDNAVLAVLVLESLPAAGWPEMPVNAIATALADVEWPARLEWRSTPDGDVLIDGAHNPAGARALASFVHEAIGHPVPLVVGVMADKAVDDVVAALAPVAAAWVVTSPASPRALSPAALAAVCRRHSTAPVLEVADVRAALAAAGHLRPGPIVVAGSLYLAGELRAGLTNGSRPA